MVFGPKLGRHVIAAGPSGAISASFLRVFCESSECVRMIPCGMDGGVGIMADRKLA